MYKIYWTRADGQACSEDYVEMIAALNQVNQMRQQGFAYVAMVGDNPNQVGQLGVDSVEAGILPNGQEYTWKKRR